jgi:hypothetical protein
MSRPARTLSLPMADALARSEPLALLLQRLRESEARFADIRDVLPAGVGAQLAPGPLDADGWTLLARHTAAAAKLRQCVPQLQQRLRERGWPEVAVRVKVHVSRGR